ncbi:MAG: FHA domain-containing protein, partial [Proteobacteria bacterium]|nr:FHA domain-containing protein [Pseudomonadota bacterium]
RDVLDLLASEVRSRGYPLLETFLSRSPKVEALATNLRGRPLSILHDAPDTLVHEQMGVLAENLLAAFESQGAQSEAEILEALRGGPPGGAGAHIGAPDRVPELVALLKPLTTPAGVALGQAALHLTRFPLRIGRLEPGVENDLAITDFPPYQLSRNHAQIVRIMGQIGVIDLGSQHGTWVDERRLGGSTGDPGPAFFTGTGGILILGMKKSPYSFEVVLGSAVGR